MSSHRTNDVLYLFGPKQVELRSEPVPEPGAGELVVKISVATTCGTDVKVYERGGHPRMLKSPCRFGHEMAGMVVAAGRGSNWTEGDRVVVANSASCGRCGPCRERRENLCEDLHYLNGAFAESILVPERFARRSVYRLPAQVETVTGALAEPLACVIHGLETVHAQRPQEVIVVGAGPIGLLFIGELAEIGVRVIVGDVVAERLEASSRIGAADWVELDGSSGDRRKLRAATESGRGAPLVVEATGSPAGWETAMGVAGSGGTVLLFGGCAPGTSVTLDSHRLHYSELVVKGAYHHRPATFAAAVERLPQRQIFREVLISEERTLDGVEEALRKMASGEILKAAIRP